MPAARRTQTRIGDVPSVGRAYVTTAAPEAVSSHQTAGMPDTAAKAFQELTAEFEAGQTTEAQVARDADKLETLLQALEYQAQGHDTIAWQETSIAALRTDAAKQLAQAITATDPQWWSAFAASYRELRASAQGRSSPSSQVTGAVRQVCSEMLRTDRGPVRPNHLPCAFTRELPRRIHDPPRRLDVLGGRGAHVGGGQV